MVGRTPAPTLPRDQSTVAGEGAKDQNFLTPFLFSTLYNKQAHERDRREGGKAFGQHHRPGTRPAAAVGGGRRSCAG